MYTCIITIMPDIQYILNIISTVLSHVFSSQRDDAQLHSLLGIG